MLNLYKTDLKRILRDRLFIIVLIIAGVYAAFSPLLFYALFKFIGVEDMGMVSFVANGKSLFLQAFLPGGDVGMILPVLISAAICKEFSHGTVRNKIISGHSRTNIFFSTYFASATVITSVMLAYALLTLGTSLIFMEYQPTPFTSSDFGYLMLSILFEVLIYLAISALTCFVLVLTRNIGLCIVGYIAICFLFTIIGSIVQSVFMFTLPEDTGYALLKFLNYTNIFTSDLILTSTSYSLESTLYAIIPPVVLAAASLFFGNLIFSKADLK